MPKPIINGSLAPVKQPDQYVYDPSRGLVLNIRYECADPSGLFSIADLFAMSRCSYTLDAGGHKSVLVAQASGPAVGQPETITDTWQILANEQQKDIKEHPDVLAMEASYPGTIGYVVRDVDLYYQGKAPGSPAPASGANPTASNLFHLLIRGSTHYAYCQYVLKHTTNVSQTFSKNIADFGVECIYTKEQLVDEIKDPNLWVFPCPPRLLYRIDNFPSPATQTGYQWGWRKLGSLETTAANNRIEINTEYWLEQWGCPLPYKAYVPPTK